MARASVSPNAATAPLTPATISAPSPRAASPPARPRQRNGAPPEAFDPAAHNMVLAELYHDFREALRESLAGKIGADLSPERHVDHARLVQAVHAGDPDRAAAEAGSYFEDP